MPYVQVWVDAEDVVEELSESELRDELARRSGNRGERSGNSADYRIPDKVAEVTLDDASQVLRKLGRVDLAYKLDEIRVDFLG